MFGFGRKRKQVEPEAEKARDLTAPEEFRRAAGTAAERLSEVLTVIGRACQPGTTTLALRDVALLEMESRGLTPTMKGSRGFPHDVAFGVNDVVLHGGPNARALQEADLVTVQANARYGHGLANLGWTFSAGESRGLGSELLQAGRETIRQVAEIVRPGLCVGDIGHTIQRHIENNRFSVVREYCGYSMGPAGMQDPQILCYGRPGTGLRLQENMIINVHVIATTGARSVRRLPDEWTVVTKDHSKSALFASMFEVVANGAVLLSSTVMSEP